MADFIVVLAGGTVAEVGSWEDLAAREAGAFRRMLTVQGTSGTARRRSED
jgi:ABC-type multidrug transport system fused ATPase/permease subunit